LGEIVWRFEDHALQCNKNGISSGLLFLITFVLCFDGGKWALYLLLNLDGPA
jgi:hypothetical protein